MLKFNCVIMLVIFCGGVHLSHGEKLKCEFKAVPYYFVGTAYSCFVTTLDNSFDNMTIDGYTGSHGNEDDNEDNNVNGIWIESKYTKYIPTGLGSLFNLFGLAISDSQLVEIKTEDFLGMQNLECLSLRNNKLTSLTSDAFSTLSKLKVIWLSDNQIEELTSELFSNNLNLEVIDLDANKIKYIGSGLFNGLTNLKTVRLYDNICLKTVYSGIDRITELKKDIITNCKNLNATATTTQNPMEIELEALKEVKDQQKKNEIELNKLRNDLKKEQLKKDEWIDQLKNDKDALKKERDVLLMELNNKTTEINKLKTKLETHCEPIEAENVKLNEINERLLKAFQNHQIEYLEIVKLKADLSTAKDQQKKEKETVELKDPKMIDFDQLNVTDNMPISNKCNSFTMNCNFLDTNGTYTCETRNLIINQAEMELSEVIETHLKSKSNQDVTELIIVKSSMSYWSNDIFNKFPALQILKIKNVQLNELKRGDFRSAFNLRVLVVNGNNIAHLGDDVFHGTEENLTEINLNSNQIEKISAETFRGLKQLTVLSLKDNLITEIPLGTFKDIVMLEILILTGNKIKFLDGKMLEFNRRLMTLAVDQNELREIGEEILEYSKMLKDVNLEGNDCIDERTGVDGDDSDGRTINDLNFVIRNCCKNSAKVLNAYNCG